MCWLLCVEIECMQCWERYVHQKKKEKSLKKLACIAQTLAVVGGVHRWSSNTQLSGDRQRTPEWNRFYVFIFLFTFSLGRHATPISGCCVLLAGRVSVIAAVAVMPFRLESHIMHLNTLTEAAAETRRHTATWSTFQTDISSLCFFHSSSLWIFACRLAAKNFWMIFFSSSSFAACMTSH